MWISTMRLQVTYICVTVGVTRDTAASQGSCHVCGCKEANFPAKTVHGGAATDTSVYSYRTAYVIVNIHYGQRGGDGYYNQN